MILENIEFILSGSGKNLLVLSQKFRNTVLISLQSISHYFTVLRCEVRWEIGNYVMK